MEATTHGTSAWTRTARVSTEMEDRTIKDYFLKVLLFKCPLVIVAADGSDVQCATEDIGRKMIEGEFHSLSEIHTLMPTFAPKPYAWGKFKKSPPDTYFILINFIDLETAAVDAMEFCSRLAQLHKNSTSPTGKFGFHITTCHGPNWQNTEWESSWCVYFTRLLRQFFKREIQQNGPWPEYEAAFEEFAKTVIPQLLEPLQSGGRFLKPCLVHGDLWEENTGTDLATGRSVIFDPSVMYAHNEYEFGMWRREIVRFSKVHLRRYFAHIPPSEPVHQWDDRNRLYSMKFNLAHSIALPATKDVCRDM